MFFIIIREVPYLLETLFKYDVTEKKVPTEKKDTTENNDITEKNDTTEKKDTTKEKDTTEKIDWLEVVFPPSGVLYCKYTFLNFILRFLVNINFILFIG